MPDDPNKDKGTQQDAGAGAGAGGAGTGGEGGEGGKPNYVQVSADEWKRVNDTLGSLSKTVGEQTEYVNASSVIINTLAYTPELKSAFQAALKKQMGVVDDGEGAGGEPGKKGKAGEDGDDAGGKDQNPMLTRRVEGIEATNRNEIINNFESEFGIADMKDEDKKVARQKIEGYLNDFGWSVKNAPLPKLKASLEKAYWGTNVEKLRDEGKLEGLVQSRANAYGRMPGVGGGSINAEPQDRELTAKQKEWLSKLGVSEEKAKKIYGDAKNESTRVNPSEAKAQGAK